jgi:hypothetical protein
VSLFGRWLNDYFRQIAKRALGSAVIPEQPDFDPEEDHPMLTDIEKVAGIAGMSVAELKGLIES